VQYIIGFRWRGPASVHNFSSFVTAVPLLSFDPYTFRKAIL